MVKQHVNKTALSWLASLLLVAAMLVSFGVATFDNHHQLIEEVIAESADVGEEKASVDDFFIPALAFKFKFLAFFASANHGNLVASVTNLQKYTLSPRAPPRFI